MLCESTNADIEELAHGIGLDARIGASFLKAGPGYGGSCFPKDTRELVCTAQAYQSPLKIVETVIAVNESHKRRMVDKVRRALGGRLDGKRIAVLGLAFKGNTDDMRDAPALTILPPLLEDGAEVVDYDPEAMDTARAVLPNGLAYAPTARAALTGADAALILTEWQEFAGLEWRELVGIMRSPLVVDLRNLYSPDFALSQGLIYVSLGRGGGRAAVGGG